MKYADLKTEAALNKGDFLGELSKNEIAWTSKIKSDLEGLPTPSQEIEYVKTFILQINK